jgi:hypothetical protein
MDIKLKPERRTSHIAAACTLTVKQQIKDYAKTNGVTESAAICYILALFFGSNFGKTEVSSSTVGKKRAAKLKKD